MTDEPPLNEEITNSEYVLFLGAGASAPLGLKPTAPFLDLLQGQLSKLIEEREKISVSVGWGSNISQLFNNAAKHHNVSLPDSEVVLDYIDDLIRGTELLDKVPDEFRDLTRSGVSSGVFKAYGEMLSRVRGYMQEVIVEHYSQVDGQQPSDCLNRL